MHLGTFTGPAGTSRQRTELTVAHKDILPALNVAPPPLFLDLQAPEPTSATNGQDITSPRWRSKSGRIRMSSSRPSTRSRPVLRSRASQGAAKPPHRRRDERHDDGQTDL
jgi:hypothetical protein